MQTNILKKSGVFLLTLFLTITQAQYKFDYGEKVNFAKKYEKNLAFIFNDNYNIYLASNINEDGMMAQREIIIRKFDQVNNLEAEFIQKFPSIDMGTLYNYLGSAKMSDDKYAFFIHAYSGRADKMEISSIIFDRKTDSFEVKKLLTYPIKSAMKSGDVDFNLSQNGHFASIVYTPHSKRKEPSKANITVYNVHDLSKVWDTQTTYTDSKIKYSDVTNSGNILMVRIQKGFKAETNDLYLISSQEEKKLPFIEKSALLKPKTFSIGSQDYFCAFYADRKIGFKNPNNSNFLMYDLKEGKILNDNKVSLFTNTSKVVLNSKDKSFEISDVIIGSDKINFIIKTKYKAGEKQKQVNPGSDLKMTFDVFNYGPVYVYSTDLGGKVTSIVNLATNLNIEIGEVSDSFGFLPIKDDIFINTGFYKGLYEFNQLDQTDEKEAMYFFRISSDPQLNERKTIINQLVNYNVDIDKLTVARYYQDNTLSLYSISNFLNN